MQQQEQEVTVEAEIQEVKASGGRPVSRDSIERVESRQVHPGLIAGPATLWSSEIIELYSSPTFWWRPRFCMCAELVDAAAAVCSCFAHIGLLLVVPAGAGP